jgi:hypothetical protein
MIPIFIPGPTWRAGAVLPVKAARDRADAELKVR